MRKLTKIILVAATMLFLASCGGGGGSSSGGGGRTNDGDFIGSWRGTITDDDDGAVASVSFTVTYDENAISLPYGGTVTWSYPGCSGRGSWSGSLDNDDGRRFLLIISNFSGAVRLDGRNKLIGSQTRIAVPFGESCQRNNVIGRGEFSRS